MSRRQVGRRARRREVTGRLKGEVDPYTAMVLTSLDKMSKEAVDIGQPPAVMPVDLADRVLYTLARRYRSGSHKSLLWTGDQRASGMTTGAVAAALGLTPGTPERQALNEALSGLRKARLLKYEYDRLVDPEVRWFLTDAGLEAGDQPAGRVP